MPNWLRKLAKVFPLAIVLTVVIGAASVKPEDAASNLSSWAKTFGIHHLPEWAQNPALDSQVVVIAFALSVLYAFAIWIAPRIKGAKMFFYAAMIFGSLFVVSLIGICLTGDFVINTTLISEVSDNSTAEKDDPSRPTLFDLFMSDFTGTFSGQTINFPREMVFKDGHRERFYGSHFYDLVANSNFLSFYIETTGWEVIVRYIGQNCKDISSELPPFTFDAKIEGDDRVIKIEDTVFSGKIFIYAPTIFDVEKLADIMRLGREHGCFIQMRGTEYEQLMQRNIRHYKQKIPPHYEVNGGIPIAVKPAIDIKVDKG